MFHAGGIDDVIIPRQGGAAAIDDEWLSPSDLRRRDAVRLARAAQEEGLRLPSQFQCQRIATSDLSIDQFRMRRQFFRRVYRQSEDHRKHADSENKSSVRHAAIETEDDLDREI